MVWPSQIVNLVDDFQAEFKPPQNSIILMSLFRTLNAFSHPKFRMLKLLRNLHHQQLSLPFDQISAKRL